MKTNKRPAMLSRQLMEDLRLQVIVWLASRRATIVPAAEYSYSFPLETDMEISRDEITDCGVSFDLGFQRDLVRVRIRPDVPAKTVIAILQQIITAVSEHGADWLGELPHATERVRTQLHLGIK